MYTTNRQKLNPSASELLQSELFRGHDQAFRRLAGLPLKIAPVGIADEHALRGDQLENPFCAALMLRSDSGREGMLQMQAGLHLAAGEVPSSASAFGGLVESAVPLRCSGELVGWLRTGQVFVGSESPSDYADIGKMLVSDGIGGDELESFETLWRSTRLVDPASYEAAVDLMAAFGTLFGEAILRLCPDQPDGDCAQIIRAKKFIQANSAEPLRLRDVAKVAGMSANYFSSIFSKSTGMTFTEFLATTRVDLAKRRLLDPHERVCETAFDVGFQSLSQFNRTFRKVAGESPSQFRSRRRSCASH